MHRSGLFKILTITRRAERRYAILKSQMMEDCSISKRYDCDDGKTIAELSFIRPSFTQSFLLLDVVFSQSETRIDISFEKVTPSDKSLEKVRKTKAIFSYVSHEIYQKMSYPFENNRFNNLGPYHILYSKRFFCFFL